MTVLFKSHSCQLIRVLGVFSLLLLVVNIYSQGVTRVRGKVYDAQTKEVIPFADVGFKGTNVGVSTDLDGAYKLETRFPSDTIFATFLGYKPQFFVTEKEKRQRIDFYLESESLEMETVEVTAEKRKYSKKNNPSLELAKKVIKNKDRNQLKSTDYYSYKQFEKIRMDLNNITEKFKNRRIFRPFKFVWDYIDTSEINGKTYLPIFLRQVASTVFYKKQGDVLRQRRDAVRATELDESLDTKSLDDLLDALYVDIDIYEPVVPLLESQFLSPLSPSGVDFYRYYIIDTIDYKGTDVINLAFIPATKGDMGFTGNLYISNDDRYTVRKVDMGIINGINLNFVRDLRIVQEYDPQDDQFVKTKDNLTIDFTILNNGLGFFGTRIVKYGDYDFSQPSDMSIFGGFENVVTDPLATKRDQSYWDSIPLYFQTQNDTELYEMIERLKKTPAYKTFVTLLRVSISGYFPAGFLDIGPVAALVSFNDVEGLNLRMGGETNYKLSRKIKLKGYVSYPRKTKIWKHNAELSYTFNEAFKDNPKHYVEISSERESSFPGQELEFFNPDNFLLSFQRGVTTKMLLTDKYEARYVREIPSFGFILGANVSRRQPYGTLDFRTINESSGDINFIPELNTTEAFFGLRIAPNEQYVQGQDKRTPIYNEYPVVNITYSKGFDNILNGEYDYHRLRINIFKQIEWDRIGTTDMILEGGKTWGDIPYIMQMIPRGNQTYVHQFSSFNLMNFLEFVGDQYVSYNFEHFFYGYFLNKIPLIRRLKLREIISGKIIFSSLSDDQNPNLNPTQIQFPVNENGEKTTFIFDNGPYVEGSIGFSNILRIFRLEMIQRFTYLNHPNVPSLFGRKGLGIRGAVLIEF